MNFSDTVGLLLRNWVFILVVTLAAGGITGVISMTRTPQYTATAGEFFGTATGASPGEIAQGNTYIQDQMSSFGQLATSPLVLAPVISDLGLPTTVKDLARVITVSTPRNTVIMQISVVGPDPAQAAAIANAVGKQVAAAVADIGPRLSNGKSLVTVRSIQEAIPPTIQSSPNTRRNVALALVAGFLLGCALVVARNLLDTRVRDADVVNELTTLPVLGAIRHSRAFDGAGLLLARHPDSQPAEDIRRLRADLLQVANGERLCVLITSSVRGEGRTTLAANLAASLAEVGRSVVLLDADLRRPAVATLTGAVDGPGLVDVVTSEATIDDVLQDAPALGFTVITAGRAHPNPAEVLSSEGMEQLLRTLRERYEFTVIDTPAIGSVSDAAALREHVNAALVVAHASTISRKVLTATLQAAAAAGLPTLGIVVNSVKDVGRRGMSNGYFGVPSALAAADSSSSPNPTGRDGDEASPGTQAKRS